MPFITINNNIYCCTGARVPPSNNYLELLSIKQLGYLISNVEQDCKNSLKFKKIEFSVGLIKLRKKIDTLINWGYSFIFERNLCLQPD